MNRAGTVLIRADGSKAIGMGHLNRSYLIAGMLKKDFGLQTKVLMRQDPLGEGFARSRGLDVVTFSAATMQEEIAFLRKTAEGETPRLVFLDVLENDTDPVYIDSLRVFGAPVVAITDDSLRRIINADLIVNGNPAQIGQDYSFESGKYLLGPKYFLMDEAYAGAHQDRPVKEVGKILVTLGASDHNDLMFKLLDALKMVSHEFALLLIVSSACGYLDRLKSYLSVYPRKCDLYIDTPTLVPFWKQADAAITAGGNTLFERIAARVPGVTLCQLIRQNEIAGAFEKLGVNMNLGFGPQLHVLKIKEGVERFLDDPSVRSMQYERSPDHVDGKGLKRLADELGHLLKL